MGPHFWARIAEALTMLSVGLFGTSIGFAVLWIRARERATRAESVLEGMRISGSRNDAMRPALDAIAEEVERIGEGQRFLTKVMSEQANRLGAPVSRIPGSVTPH